MRRQPALAVLAAVTVAALVAIGIAEATRRSSGSLGPAPSAAQVQADLRGSPAPLRALHAQADQLLGGGAGALRGRLASLRGYPVVLNKWASWCVPCRAEFPVLQRVSAQEGRQIAFVGIDSGDYGDPRAFLAKYPVSYPSYADRSGAAGTAITETTGLPVTVFYDAAGHMTFIHEGGFQTVAQLEIDVRRYALDQTVTGAA